jgi:hypothetical protein
MMQGATCKSCKFWGHYRAGECDRVGGLFPDNPAASFEVVARVLDDSGLSTGLATGPDFGCVHHVGKKGGRNGA